MNELKPTREIPTELEAAGVAFGRTLTALLLGAVSMALVIGGLFFFGKALLDSLSNRGLTLLMVGAISVMVCLWLGGSFAIDRWYWLPKARRLPTVPSLHSGFLGLPSRTHPKRSSSRGYRIAHSLGAAVFVLASFAAFTGFFLRGPSSFFIKIGAFLIYPFIYIGVLAILQRFRH